MPEKMLDFGSSFLWVEVLCSVLEFFTRVMEPFRCFGGRVGFVDVDHGLFSGVGMGLSSSQRVRYSCSSRMPKVISVMRSSSVRMRVARRPTLRIVPVRLAKASCAAAWRMCKGCWSKTVCVGKGLALMAFGLGCYWSFEVTSERKSNMARMGGCCLHESLSYQS